MFEQFEQLLAYRIKELEELIQSCSLVKQTVIIKRYTEWNKDTLEFNREILKRFRQHH
jgi:hypothetical protein